MNMNLKLVKCIVKGEIQTISQCIFDKFSFPTYSLAMIQNDAEIDNYSLVYFPMLSHAVNSQIHFYYYFLCILVKLFY